MNLDVTSPEFKEMIKESASFKKIAALNDQIEVCGEVVFSLIEGGGDVVVKYGDKISAVIKSAF